MISLFWRNRNWMLPIKYFCILKFPILACETGPQMFTNYYTSHGTAILCSVCLTGRINDIPCCSVAFLISSLKMLPDFLGCFYLLHICMDCSSQNEACSSPTRAFLCQTTLFNFRKAIARLFLPGVMGTPNGSLTIAAV